MSSRSWMWRALAGASLLVSMWARAQSVPTGFQEYYLSGHSEQMNDLLEDFRVREGANSFPAPRGLNAVTTLTATTDVQVVVYDHWEDGYEADPLSPTQSSTLVLGDGNTANGNSADFGGITGDLINVNTVLTWTSRDDTGQPDTVNDYIPYPRSFSPLELRYDAPDRLVVIGGAVNVVHAEDPRTPHAADAWGVYPRELLGDTTEYFIPIGENSYSSGGHFAPFQYVYLQLTSYADGVNITVNNGVSTVTFQLDEGDTWASIGKINFTSIPASQIQIRSGTSVSASGPVTALLMTASDSSYQTRTYALLPEALFGNDYVIPVYGDSGSVNGDREHNVYVYNPHSTALTVTAYDTARPNGQNMTVPARGIVAYTQNAGVDDEVPTGSTVRLTADRHFWGITALDYLGTAGDWGLSLVPSGLATNFVTSSWAPGNGAAPPSSSTNSAPLWVSPLFDNTLIQVDIDGDGVFDQIDTDGNGSVNTFTGTNGYLVSTLNALRIYDVTDRDQTRVRIFGSNRFTAAYGQDSEVAPSAGDALDLGYDILPPDQRFLNNVLVADLTSDVTTLPSSGGNVVFTVRISTLESGPVTGVDVSHFLPTGFNYVGGTGLVTYPGGGTAPINPTETGVTGGTRLSFDLDETLDAAEVLLVTFTANAPGATANGRYEHSAAASGSYAGWPFNPSDRLSIVKSPLTLALTVDDDEVAPGGALTYSATVRNTSGSTVNSVVVRIPVPFDTTYTNLGGGTYSGRCRCVSYNVGNLAAGAESTSTLQVSVAADAGVGTTIFAEARATATGVPEAISPVASSLVRAPDLVGVLAGPSVALSPSTYTYRYTVSNVGNQSASSVVALVDIPANTTYVTGSMTLSQNGGAYVAQSDASDADPANTEASPAPRGAVRVALPTMAVGDTFTLRFQVTVANGLADATIISAVGTMDSSETPLESSNTLSTVINNSGDTDGDGLSNTDEVNIHNTDPFDRDSDDDGVSDGAEVNTYGTSPLDHDSDGDGVFDGTEVGVTVALSDTDVGAGHFRSDLDPTTTTDPLDPDSDAGGNGDGDEDANRNGRIDVGEGDPNDFDDDDADGDGLDNGTESGAGTSHLDADSDDDGIPDGSEADWNVDSDGTGLINALDPDSDDDGVLDGTEVGLTVLDLGPDTDLLAGNFVADADPTTTTDMLEADSDTDGLDDGAEDLDGNGRVDAGETDPNEPDSDGDTVLDGADNCRLVANTDQDDNEGDGQGDLCDTDDDNDGFADGADNCQFVANASQADLDGDTIGDACDPDADGDGQNAGPLDCDDFDDTAYSGAPELCDGVDNACSGSVPGNELDADGDGYVGCALWVGTDPSILDGGDCNDLDDTSFPGATEVCDGDDNACAGSVPTNELDADGDGYVACGPWNDSQGDDTLIVGGSDCAPSNDAVHPGATEVCDGLDTNCTGGIPADEQDPDGDDYLACASYVENGAGFAGGDDCAPTDGASHPLASEVCDGNDNDCAGGVPPTETDDDGDGYVECSGFSDTQGDNPGVVGGGDCNDLDDTSFPGATELCDGDDNACAGSVPANELDADGDGYVACGPWNDSQGDDTLIVGGSDCAPSNDAVHPGATEVCDGLDTDCTGGIPADEQDPDGDDYLACASYVENGAGFAGGDDCAPTDGASHPLASEVCDGNDNDCAGGVPATETDDDGDGYVECSGFSDTQGDNPGVVGGGDCNDGSAAVSPGATEVACNGINDDCNFATVDEVNATDADFDGYTVLCGNDCDDTNFFVHPGSVENCTDGFDNNCDGLTDAAATAECPAGCADVDADGYPDATCGGSDCDDNDPFRGPGSGEDCNDGVDNDCNTLADDADPLCPSGCDDDDGDGYYAASCGGSDCDDTRPDIHPGLAESCSDGIDNNCDGLADAADAPECPSGCADADSDGYPAASCGGTDCNDSTGAIRPGAGEMCTNGVDDDCNGHIDGADLACPDACADADGDGYADAACGGSDCDDTNPTIHPGRAEVCGGGVDDDCDGLVDVADPIDCPAGCADADADGYPDATCGGSDCDDGNPFIGPFAGESCSDGVDNDCNTLVDASDPLCPSGCADADGDGYFDAACGGSDCDDSRADVNPGEAEICIDGIDNDCNGLSDTSDTFDCPAGCGDADGDGYADSACGGADCNDASATVHPGAGEMCTNGSDDDCDGDVDGDDAACPDGCSDADGDGYADGACGGSDCNDGNATVSPGAVEECTDGLDNDCDGRVDAVDVVECPAGCADADGDGYPDATCGGTDCDDASAAIAPGAGEACGDGVDNDCNGFVDGADAACPSGCADVDNDGYFDATCGGSDCDDARADVHPGLAEICVDGIDNDCNGLTDAADSFDCPAGCADADGDGFADATCGGTDCNDAESAIYPGAGEMCTNAVDDDCNGNIDGADAACPGACTDADGDGYFDAACGGSDCDDQNPTVHPGRTEQCSGGTDDDCDGLIDAADVVSCPADCDDADADGYPNASCGGSDCDDGNPFVGPHAGEACDDGVDNNCDARTDAADPLCPTGCADADGDGYFDAACGGSDCDDARADTNPGAAEICVDGIDNDCNGLTDGADTFDCPAGCADADGDGYADAACGGSDCNDASAAVHPGAGEMCTNGSDDDCDGDVDGDDAACPDGCADVDGDGYFDSACGGADCNDATSLVNPSRAEDCSDGVDNDCDSRVDTADLVDCPAGCADADGDGYADITCGGTDCDDGSFFVSPGRAEQCTNGRDDECDAFIDFDDVFDCPSDCVDADGDGHYAIACGGNDCDDEDAAVHPGAAEMCTNGGDDNCNGLADGADVADCPAGCTDGDADGYPDRSCGGTDCDDGDAATHPGAAELACDAADNDCNDLTTDAPDVDRDGYADASCAPGDDCRDDVALINPGAGERCDDGQDNNCDALADGADPLCPSGCADADDDGYADAACGGADCADDNQNRHPGAGEHCSDGIDNDCDGALDDADSGDCPPGCPDLDGDGYRSAVCGGSDCNDARFDVFPGAGEHCGDGVDNDCNGLVDEGDGAACPADCVDGDGDGYPSAACGGTDCDDGDVHQHPGAGEQCGNGADDNCDARIDAADPFCPAGCTDADGDGYYDAACGGSDCDDDAGSTNPGAVEVCSDTADNDCNGLVDFSDAACPSGCADADGDGFLDASCGGQDCVDDDASSNPLGTELTCDGIDQDCNLATPDDADPTDADGDGFTVGCGGDCNDGDARVNGSAVERCDDDFDNDCNGDADADDAASCPADCSDADGDGYPDATCGGSDCNDGDFATSPGGGEHCSDGADNDCDGDVDENDSECPADCADADGDGYKDAACGGTDCADDESRVHPGYAEDCGDGLDNDCDGRVDAADVSGCPESCADGDGDGRPDLSCGGTDCDDGEPSTYPSGDELCDALDNDCDGSVDEGLDACDPDGDGDGDGDGDDDDDARTPGLVGGCSCDSSGPGNAALLLAGLLYLVTRRKSRGAPARGNSI